jgi:hypothetical protein
MEKESQFLSFLTIPIISDQGTRHDVHSPAIGIPILDGNGNRINEIETAAFSFWIPPSGMNSHGEIAAGKCREMYKSYELPTNCLSLVTVISKNSYSAKIKIFDDMGRLVHSSTQTFGECGELDNPIHLYPNGYISFLVWNLRDLDGRLADAGVYQWKVTYSFPGGLEIHETYGQGIACNTIEPMRNCAFD